MTKIVPSEDARQGRRGYQVLVVLVVALVLAMGAWYAAEMFGRSTEAPQTQTGVGGLPAGSTPPSQ